MTVELNRDDPVASLLEGDEPTASIEEVEGYQRVRFVPEMKAQLEAYLDEELRLGEADYKPIHDHAIRMEKVYEGISDTAELLTICIAKRDANQIISTLVNRIWEPSPICTVQPEEQQQFRILVPGSQMPGPDGEPVTVSRQEVAWTDEVARTLEMQIEHKLRKRVDFFPTLTKVTTQMIKGVSPAWIKTSYEKRTRTVRQPLVHDLGDGWVTVLGTEDVEIVDGDPHKLLFRNTTEIMLPADSMDEQEAPWIAERIPTDPVVMREKLSKGEYETATPEERQAILEALEAPGEETYDRRMSAVDKRQAKTPRKLHNVWEVWAYWPILTEDGNVGIYSLCIHYHRTAKKVLQAYINPYNHGKRPYVPFFQRQRPTRFSGGSCVEDLAPFQKVISVAMHLQLNNAAQANQVAFLVRSGSKAWNWLSKNPVGPGSKIPVDRMENEVKPFPVGSNFRSMDSEIGFLDQQASNLSTVNKDDWEVPNRTPVGTTDIVAKTKRQQMNLVLETSRWAWGKVFKLLVQQMQQYDIYGSQVPFQNPRTRAIAMIPLRMPVEAITDQFSFMLTASSEDDDRDGRLARVQNAKKMLTDSRHETLSLMGPMFNPQAPPSVQQVLKKFVAAEQELAAEVLELSGITDRDRFVLTSEDIDSSVQLQQQWAQQQAEKAATQPPPVKVNLTSKLTPEQEAAAAQAIGIGGSTPNGGTGQAAQAPQPAIAGQHGVPAGGGAGPA